MTTGVASAPSPSLVLRLLPLAVVVVAGIVVRFWGLAFGLPHTQARPDETQVMDVSLAFLRGNAWPAFFDYPRFYNYLLTLAYLGYFAVGAVAGWFGSLAAFVASWPVDWGPFFLINRGLSALAGAAAIPVVYLLGLRLGERGTGLLSALFLAFAYLHVRESHFGTTDTTLALLCALSVLWLIRADAGRGRRPPVVAAVLAGLAAATKYNGVVLLLPLALGEMLRLREGPDARRPGVVAGRALALGAAFAVAFTIGVPFIFHDFAPFRGAMVAMALSLHGGLGPQAGATNGWSYHLGTSLRYGLGLPLLACGVAGIAVAGWRNWRTALLAFSFPAAYFVVAGSLGALFVRYALPIVPFLCVGAAITVVAVARLVTRRAAWQGAAAAVMACVVLAPSLDRVIAFDRIMARPDNRVTAADWIAHHAEAGATIIVSGSLYGYPQFGTRVALWSWHRKLKTFAFRERPVDGRPDWILLQESPLPSYTQPAVMGLLAADYDRLTVLRAYDPQYQAGNLYDVQDAFYLPFAAFDGVRRAGPNFTIYKRRDARYVIHGDNEERP